MTKTVTHIPCPKEWESTNDWDSHRPMLWLSLKNTPGLVIEVGCGNGSTQLIQNDCYNRHRSFVSFETNKEWATLFANTWLVDNYSKGVATYMDRHEIDKASLIFIDCAPAEERKHLLRLYSNSLVLLIHDTEPTAEYVYGMKEVLNGFKYRLNYAPEGLPHTTAVSNVIDLIQWT
jgi:hypothetical protein